MVEQTKQSCIFENMIPISEKEGNFQEFQTSNLVFPANNIIFMLYFIGISRLILSIGYPEYIPLCLVGLLLLNISCYWFILKTFNAAVMVGKQGVNLQAFRLKKFAIRYEEIESAELSKRKKRSKKESFLVGVGILIFCGFVTYMAVLNGEGDVFLQLIFLLPLMLFVERKRKTRFGNLNTHLYIQIKHKKWYEFTYQYTLIADEASAAQINSCIEKQCRTKNMTE